ncbi:MAG: MFS transporter [Acidimicrobiales bacterium]
MSSPASPLGAAFGRLWTAAALANLADGVFRVALPLLAVRLTTSPALVAGVVVAQRLPWLLLALPAGALADRLDRRRAMVAVQLLRAAVLCALAVLAAAEAETMVGIYAAALALGVGETVFDTSAQSILPSVVDRRRLSEANGRLFAVELTANELVGPTVGGLLAAAALWSAFAGGAGAYALAAASLAAMAGSYRPVRTGPPAGIRAEMAEGLRFVWGNRVLRALALMLGGSSMALTAWMSVFVLFAVDPGPMGLSPAGYGLLLSTGAAGGIAGSWAGAAVERALGRARCLALAVAALSGAMLAPVLTASVAANAAALVLATSAAVVWNVITVSLRQSITPDHLLGRMNAAYRLLGWGTMPVGAALGGAVAQALGLRATFLAASLVGAAVLVGSVVVTDEAIAAAEGSGGATVG